MALPGLSDVKAALRIETNAADTELTAILARATGLVRYFIDRPIEATAKTYVLEADGERAYRVLTRLFLPDAPVKLAGPAPILTDMDGNTVDAATYRVTGETGEVRCLAGFSFAAWPYTVTATVGLAVASDYAARIEPLLAAAIIDTCMDFYARKNAAARSESEGGGVSVSFGPEGLPPRVMDVLTMLRRPGVV